MDYNQSFNYTICVSRFSAFSVIIDSLGRAIYFFHSLPINATEIVVNVFPMFTRLSAVGKPFAEQRPAAYLWPNVCVVTKTNAIRTDSRKLNTDWMDSTDVPFIFIPPNVEKFGGIRYETRVAAGAHLPTPWLF